MNAKNALQAILDRMDYTRANCRLQDTVGDRLTPEMIADARMAIEFQGGDGDAGADDALVSVPISDGFDHHKPPIGFLRVQRTALPPTPDFVFAIGYLEPNVGTYKLTEVSLVADGKYIAYLQQTGKLPAAADAVGKKESEAPQ
jgi:hypothetical protein